MFTQKVIDELQSYVYALVDPRNNCIFYIGKGKGNRVFQHAEDALQENTDIHNLKLETIRSIHKDGLKVKHYIIRHKLSDETAFWWSLYLLICCHTLNSIRRIFSQTLRVVTINGMRA